MEIQKKKKGTGGERKPAVEKDSRREKPEEKKHKRGEREISVQGREIEGWSPRSSIWVQQGEKGVATWGECGSGNAEVKGKTPRDSKSRSPVSFIWGGIKN